MLGSLPEAEDAVQEVWLRLNRTDASGVENLGGWLTTVVARVCLDMLRSRKARREEVLDDEADGGQAPIHAIGADPENEVPGAAPGPRSGHSTRRGAHPAARGRGARFVRLALVDGAVGLILAPRGRLMRALRLTIAGQKIVQVEIVADPARLRDLDLTVLDGSEP